ncbi:prepilin peptidase [Alteribacillus iranensis]|uniref:Prepilin leader peptidase/N-methyltransferase n=1 Tax=Alteribacillus iranensis TaxID=930128 RepID=A0A1I2CQU3_9BACI|nr:A24 family peptidase [Alteribacillus iranensis]SFE70542.1 type 4 prepilin peptidase 1 Aspartic peptidase. MEROPS family A24A [Alteribacillus iranensis]
MEIIGAVYFFIIGLVFGSFFNVVGMRVPQQESIVAPRSHCTACGRTLSALDLVPVFSYLFLKGKCRTCGAAVSPLYPVIELITGLLYALAWVSFGWSWEFPVAILLISLLVIITVSDITAMLIPDVILLFFVIPFLLLRFTVVPLDPWWDVLAGAALGFFLLLLIAIVSKGGMGGGDIKLFAVLGVVFGWKEVLLVFFLSVFLGAMIGVAGMLLGKVKRGVPMAFGPFIAAAAILTLFFGSDIIDWYTGFY